MAVSPGIVINELFTNSVKYAFPLDRKGEISIKLLRKRISEVRESEVRDQKESSGKDSVQNGPDKIDERFTFVFADNGRGVPEDLGSQKSGISWLAACKRPCGPDKWKPHP